MSMVGAGKGNFWLTSFVMVAGFTLIDGSHSVFQHAQNSILLPSGSGNGVLGCLPPSGEIGPVLMPMVDRGPPH
jgi:hypothetical protein